MDLRDLRIFATVAERGAITRASADLHMVQSNVTARIQALEHAIGAQLFVRRRTGVELTDEGRLLLPYASRIQSLVDEAQAAVQSTSLEPCGTLRLGSMETTMATRLPKVLADFRSDCPKVDIKIGTGPTRRLLRQVIDRELDCALVAGPVASDLLDQAPVLQEELVVVSSARWASLDDYLSGSGNPTVLVFREGCSYRDRFLDALAAMGHRTFTQVEFGTLDGILGCVECDLGITMVPREVIVRAPNGSGLRVHQVPADRSQVETLLVWRRDLFDSVAFRVFRERLTRTWQG